MEQLFTFKTLRTDYLKITQKEYAEKLGLSRSSIAKKESGKVALTQKDLKLLKKVFKINLGMLDI